MTEEAQREQSRQAWRLIHFQGWSQRQVALHLGLDQSTISRRLKELEAELAQEFRAEVEEHRARQTLYLQHIMQQSMVQWEKSCQDSQTLAAKSGRRMRGPDGQPLELPDEQLRHEVPGRGDVRYFNTAIRAMIELRKIWRLDAPPPPAPSSTPSTPSTSSTPTGGPDYDEIIYHVHTLPGTYEEPERGNPSASPAPGGIDSAPAPCPAPASPRLTPSVPEVMHEPRTNDATHPRSKAPLSNGWRPGGQVSVRTVVGEGPGVRGTPAMMHDSRTNDATRPHPPRPLPSPSLRVSVSPW